MSSSPRRSHGYALEIKQAVVSSGPIWLRSGPGRLPKVNDSALWARLHYETPQSHSGVDHLGDTHQPPTSAALLKQLRGDGACCGNSGSFWSVGEACCH